MIPMADNDGLLEDLAMPELASFELLDEDTQGSSTLCARIFSADRPSFLRMRWARSQLAQGVLLTCGGLALIAATCAYFGEISSWGSLEPGPGSARVAAAAVLRARTVQRAAEGVETRATPAAAAPSTSGEPAGLITVSGNAMRSNDGGSLSRVGNPRPSGAGGRGAANSSASSAATGPLPGGGSRAANSSTPAAAASAARARSAASSPAPASAGTARSSATSCAGSVYDRYPACRSAGATVGALRCRSWPLRGKAPAPRISRALYVNMDTDLPRRRWMEGRLPNCTPHGQLRGGRCGFAVERVPAVDTRQAATDPEFEAIRRRGFSRVTYPKVEGKWSVAGCMFSHLRILRRLQQHAQELLAAGHAWLVLEDDAMIGEDIEAAWKRLWPWLPEDWDLVRLGWFGASTCTARINDHVDLALWSDPPPAGPCGYCGSHAYVVNPASAGKVAARLEGSRMMHVDCLLGSATPPREDPNALPPLLSFAALPIVVKQNEDFPSDRTD